MVMTREDMIKTILISRTRRQGRRQEETVKIGADELQEGAAEFGRVLPSNSELRADAMWGREYTRLGELRRIEMEGEVVKIRVSIQEMLDPVVFEYLGDQGSERTLLSGSLLNDGAGGSIPTTDIIDIDLINQLEDLRDRHAVLEITGVVVTLPHPAEHSAKVFAVLPMAVRSSAGALQLLGASPGEIKVAEDKLEELAGHGIPVLHHLKSELVVHLGIQGLKDVPLLEEAIDFSILQAFSEGTFNQTSGKLHSLSMGCPGAGKKLIALTCAALNPVYEEAHPGKVTPAGLCGATRRAHGRWISDPGSIPLAHGGVLVIQDAHTIPRSALPRISGVLSMAMEDGVVVDSTAAHAIHAAETAVTIDLNKKTDLVASLGRTSGTVSGATQRVQDIGLPQNVLTRFDFITDFPRDAARQAEVALAMYDRTLRRSSSSVLLRHEPWVRPLQVMVALLRDRNPNPDYSPIQDELREIHRELVDANRDQLHRLPMLSDFQTRMANTAMKMSMALCRAHGTEKAKPEMVEVIEKVLRRKVDFIATLEPDLVVQDPHSAQARRDWILTRFSGQEVTTGDLHEACVEELGERVTRRTIERDLKYVAARIRHGVHRVMGPDKHAPTEV